MANFNSKVKFNKTARSGGARYNSAPFVLKLVLHESFLFNESFTFNVAAFYFREGLGVGDSTSVIANYQLNNIFTIKESDIKYSSLISLLDSFNSTEVVLDVFANLKTNDEVSLFESGLNQLNSIIASDSIKIKEIADLEALLNTYDTTEFADAYSVFASLFRNDNINIIDKDPKSAVSDFYITKSQDGIYDVIMPFGLILDYSRTSIDFMPEAVDTSTTIDGVDGEVVQSTVYKSRLFDLYAVSQDGLNLAQKEEIKEQIAQILHSIKNETKTITFAERETSFEVKYSGLAKGQNKTSWVDFQLPLKSQSAFGYKQFTKDLEGSGLLENTGDKEVGVTITISGYADNISFLMGDRPFSWSGAIQEGEKLVIDTDTISCYKIDVNGKRINAKQNLVGNPDKKIPVGSIALSLHESIEYQTVTTWREMVLY